MEDAAALWPWGCAIERKFWMTGRWGRVKTARIVYNIIIVMNI